MDNWLLICALSKGQSSSPQHAIKPSTRSPLRGGRQLLLASLPLTITQTNRGCHWNKSWSQEAEREWKHPVSECCKWPWDISCKYRGVWLYSQARTNSDAFLSHEILFLKYHSCTLGLHRINKICGRQIYLCLQEALSSFWILDHLRLSMAPSFCFAVQGLQSSQS